MLVVRNTLRCITHCLTHLWWKIKAKSCFQNIANTAFTRLTVDSYNIRIITPSDISRIDWKIWNCPMIWIFFVNPFHSFCDCILMWTRKCGKHQCSTIRTSFPYCHTCIFFVLFYDSRHIRKIKFRINALCIHIHCNCNNIHITCTLTISKQCTFHTVCPC